MNPFSKQRKLFCSFFAAITLFSSSAFSQYQTILNPDRLTFQTSDSLFSLRINPVLQNQFQASQNRDTNVNTSEFINRRTRIYLTGHIFDSNLSYKVQLRFESDVQTLFDAAFKYKVNEQLSFWMGQETLPAARSQLVSLKNLQFPERSVVHSVFDLQKDLGVWAFFDFDLKKSHFKTSLALTNGEGIFRPAQPKGKSYTARLDFLPLGKFINNGDVRASDLERHPSPKLAFGYAFNSNDNANASRGQRGFEFPNNETRDITNHYIDMMFKYSGVSVMSEFIIRNTENPVVNIESVVYKGRGFNINVGYLFDNDVEIAARYATIIPSNEISSIEPKRKDYTIGLSKYIVGHNLKIQADFTYQKNTGAKNFDILEQRVKIQLNF